MHKGLAAPWHEGVKRDYVANSLGVLQKHDLAYLVKITQSAPEIEERLAHFRSAIPGAME
jgi:hypothetical protein